MSPRTTVGNSALSRPADYLRHIPGPAATHGPVGAGLNYAVQGNILTGEDVVIAMETAFLETKGTLADRMYAALIAGNAKDSDLDALRNDDRFSALIGK